MQTYRNNPDLKAQHIAQADLRRLSALTGPEGEKS